VSAEARYLSLEHRLIYLNEPLLYAYSVTVEFSSVAVAGKPVFSSNVAEVVKCMPLGLPLVTEITCE